jgi:hypothetical protein
MGKIGPKILAQTAVGFVGNDNATLKQKLLNQPQTSEETGSAAKPSERRSVVGNSGVCS